MVGKLEMTHSESSYRYYVYIKLYFLENICNVFFRFLIMNMVFDHDVFV